MSVTETQAREWVARHVMKAEPLETAANLASWEAAITGQADAIQRSAEGRAAVRRLYADPEAAGAVKQFLPAGVVDDADLHRQLILLDLAYTGNQLPATTLEDLSRREAELEQSFYTFRADFEGAAVSNNLLLDVLRTEKDNGRRRSAWEASKTVGREVSEAIRGLIRVRNQGASSLGYRDYYSMELALQEIDEDDLFRVLDEFRAGTDEPFAKLRAGMDIAMAERYGISPSALRPWHWEDFFSQEAPSLGTVDLDNFLRDSDLAAIARKYFEDIHLPVGDVLDRSDLYERDGKDQHAFCIDVDRARDVRVLCNLRNNERSMSTLLHELGHAAYDAFLPAELPYLLRTPAHTMTTESIAMFMGRLTRDPAWLSEYAGAALSREDEADLARQLRTSMLVSARWILVMVYFERELYRDPDREDLNELWWSLVESIQLVTPPEGRDEPDWAAKIHLSLAPVYYHNYLLGEMTASQLGAALDAARADGAVSSGPGETGIFLRERVFGRGAALPWNALLREATGEELSPRFFVKDFV